MKKKDKNNSNNKISRIVKIRGEEISLKFLIFLNNFIHLLFFLLSTNRSNFEINKLK